MPSGMTTRYCKCNNGVTALLGIPRQQRFSVTLSAAFVDGQRLTVYSLLRAMRRVVITGMGVVSPNGIGKEAFCRAVLSGKSGVSRITPFDASSLPVQI